MKREQWSYSRALESRYERDMRQIMQRVLPDFFPISGISIPAKQLSAGQFLEMWARQAAQRMITGTLAHSARTWREAAQEGMKGPEIYRALRESLNGPVGVTARNLVDQNARLIQSVPEEVAARITRYVQEQATKGIRAQAMEAEIRRMAPKLAASRIRLIARTETSKASTALTRARSEELELDWYIWQTSKDQRVRPSHRKMDGVLVSWTEPCSPEALFGEPHAPSPYDVGCIYNCRCFGAPLLRLNQLSWPHRCYMDGKIRMISLADFRRIAGTEVAA